MTDSTGKLSRYDLLTLLNIVDEALYDARVGLGNARRTYVYEAVGTCATAVAQLATASMTLQKEISTQLEMNKEPKRLRTMP